MKTEKGLECWPTTKPQNSIKSHRICNICLNELHNIYKNNCSKCYSPINKSIQFKC